MHNYTTNLSPVIANLSIISQSIHPMPQNFNLWWNQSISFWQPFAIVRVYKHENKQKLKFDVQVKPHPENATRKKVWNHFWKARVGRFSHGSWQMRPKNGWSLKIWKHSEAFLVYMPYLRGDNPLIVAWLLRNAYLHYLRRFLAQIFSIDSNHAPLSLQKIWASSSLF